MARSSLGKASLQKFYNALSKETPKTAQQLSEETGLSPRTIKNAINELYKQGEITVFDCVKVRAGVRGLNRYVLGDGADFDISKVQDMSEPFRDWLDVAFYGEYRVS